jgi:caa(3)-type oxidase subunit IV
MSNHSEHGHDDDDHGHHGPGYIKVYWILLVLFIISVMGPEMAHLMDMSPTMAKVTVLITAFGIAFVKAYYVIAYFMHLKFEIKYVQYMLGTTVVFMLLFFSAVAPDVMRHDGACQRWAEENGQKVCKIYNWTNSSAAAEVVYASTRQAHTAAEQGKKGGGKVVPSQSDEWSNSGVLNSQSRGVAARDKMIAEKKKGMHKSYWYAKTGVSSNQLADPKVLDLKGKHMVAGLQRNYLPIKDAMKRVMLDGAKPMMLPSADVFDPKAPKPAEWAKARVKAAELLSKPLAAVTLDPTLVAKGRDLWSGKVHGAKVGALPCQTCHSIDGSKNTGPTLKGFYGRITTFKNATVARNDKAYFVRSIKRPDSQMSKDYPDGGMINVAVTDDEVDALFQYIASLK